MQMLASNLAYRYLAFALMLLQANWFCQKMDLPGNHELTLADIGRGSEADPPKTNDFGGSIFTDEYFFGFDSGHIANFYKRAFEPQTDADVKRLNVELSKHSSVIDTNGAFDLATNWLARSGVNVAMLKTNFTLTVTQEKFLSQSLPAGGFGPITRSEVLLPVFDVVWSGDFVRKGRLHHHGPVVRVTVSGATKEMLEYHVYSEQLFTFESIAVKDLEKVMNVSDQEFQSYSDLQLSNFVAEYGKVGIK
jgi:hypothetical protein